MTAWSHSIPCISKCQDKKKDIRYDVHYFYPFIGAVLESIFAFVS